ncbi:hypothetical protein BGZ98_002672 [Dissophora globulifera]|nr:hypothetical protein BGZ98_002672 [Dissophora globulifera]
MSSAEQYIKTEHPVIDSDPHFNRVVGYMRTSDLATWGAATAAAPAILLGLAFAGNTIPDEPHAGYAPTRGRNSRRAEENQSGFGMDKHGNGYLTSAWVTVPALDRLILPHICNTHVVVAHRLERLRPGAGPKGINLALKVATGLGFMGGFLLAYQNSSLRFWGWSENAREQEMNRDEMAKRVAAGLPVYGEPTMDEASQAAAARNSKYAAIKFSAIPWFNTTNHKYHLSESTPSDK